MAHDDCPCPPRPIVINHYNHPLSTTTVGDKKGSKQSLALTISRELFLSIRVLFSINILTGRYRLFQFNSLYVLQDRM